MYVCVCNALKEARLKEIAVQHPEVTTEEAYELLGIEPDCGTCLDYADGVMKEAREHHVTPPNSSIA